MFLLTRMSVHPMYLVLVEVKREQGATLYRQGGS